MKVVATKRGYIDHQVREEGAEFDIPDEPKGKDGKTPAAFSSKWMKSLEPKADKADGKKSK